MAENPTWVDVQRKTFTRWMNQFLSERMKKCENLEEDLKDGTALCNLLEIISSKSLGKFNKSPSTRYHFLENNSVALRFVQSEGLKVVGIGPEDIADGKTKLDLGLIWTIILRYHINVIGEGSPKFELLKWVREQIQPYDLAVKGDDLKNFTTNWQDGTVLFALTDSLKPGILTPENMSGLAKNPMKDVQTSIDTAEREYDIPPLLDAVDVVNNPDELSLMTYISYFRDFLSDEARKKRLDQERRRKTALPSNCYATGPGVEHGKAYVPNDFTIHSVNCNGDPLKTGGVHFDAKVEGPTHTTAKIKDNGDGTYSGQYTVDKPGDYTVSIVVTGQDGIGADELPRGHPGWNQHIKDSPFKVPIAGPNAGHSYATGPGVEGARTGHPANFKIHSVDDQGKPLKNGGAPFKASVSGPEKVGNVALVDNGDGTYDGAYTVNTPGKYQVDINLDGHPIKNSPYHLVIEKANPHKSWAEGPGLKGGQQNKEGEFTIHSVDADGHPVKSGGDPFHVKVAGPGGNVEPKIHDNNDGTYTVKYTPHGHGDYKVDVTLHDQPIKDAPFHVKIKPAPDAGKSWAEGPGLEEAWDNEPAVFTIHSVDLEGHPRHEGGDPFTVDIKGPVPTKAHVVDNKDGTYSVTYNPDAPGDYTVNVDLEGKPIKDAPFKVKCKAGSDADNSGFGIFSFTLQSRDKRGNNKTFGGDKFEVNIKGPDDAEISVQTEDNGDGTYTAIYALGGEDVKGKVFKVHAKLNGKTVGSFNQNM